jgi:glutathione S-transferase
VAVLHISTPAEWASAQASGAVAPASLASEGFVHCSTDEQLASTIARHFGGADELVLLRLHEELAGELVWEEARPGEAYPHLYRPIALHEVAEVIPWHRDGHPA